MKSIILAAGYATRLYPLTQNFPKPLLKVCGKSILDRLIADIDVFPEINEHIIISNHKFISHFEQWKKQSSYKKKITILDDLSTENENRLGAVKDIAFALETLQVNESVLVLAGDNVLDFSLRSFVEYQQKKQSACIMRHFENDKEKLQRTGVAVIDENEKVIKMQEKPQNPQSSWAVPPFYIYTKEDLPFIKNAVKENKCKTDAPGEFISWFCSVRSVYAWKMTGTRHDIGNLKSYEEASEIFRGK